MNIVIAFEELVLLWSSFLILTFISFQMQKIYIRCLYQVGGRSLVLFPASFAVPVHELSHGITALLCGHKVTKIVLFEVNGSGTLGYVNYSYRPTILSPFANTLIGLAPLIGGFTATYLISSLLNPDALQLLRTGAWLTKDNYIDTSVTQFTSLWHLFQGQLDSPAFWIWSFLVSSILVFSIPSVTDFSGAAIGIVILLLVYAVTYTYWGMDSLVHRALVSIATVYTPLLFLSCALVGVQIVMLLFVGFAITKKQT